MVTLTKDMVKDFNFMSDYCYEAREVLENRIFWDQKILFATNGRVFLWTETTEENPEGFTVWQKDKKNYVLLDTEKTKELKDAKLKERIIDIYTQFNFDFTLKYDKENVGLCSSLANSKKNRHLDRISFDFAQDNVDVVFDAGNEYNETELNMGNILTDIQGNYAKDYLFKLPLWNVLLLAKQTKDDLKCKIRFDRVNNSYIKMISGKWNLIAMGIKD